MGYVSFQRWIFRSMWICLLLDIYIYMVFHRCRMMYVDIADVVVSWTWMVGFYV